MKEYQFSLEGLTPLLIHADNLEAADFLEEWRLDPENRDKSKKGDDRVPGWTWQMYLYHDGKHLTIPSDNLMVALRQAGAKIQIPGQGKRSYKQLTQSGLVIPEEQLTLIGLGGPIALKDLPPRNGQSYFAQAKAVEPLGFRLFAKRARIGAAKHVRVRPRFDQWRLSGTLQVIADDVLHFEVLKEILARTGLYEGLCDWRPSSPRSPGPFGRFKGELKAV